MIYHTALQGSNSIQQGTNICNFLNFLFIIPMLISVLQGKAGGTGERGPPGKLVSVVYLVDIFLLNISLRALIIFSTFTRSITLTTADCTDL